MGDVTPVTEATRQLDAMRAELGRLRGRERDALIDFCAHLEARRGLNVPASWATMVDDFLAEYNGEEARAGG